LKPTNHFITCLLQMPFSRVDSEVSANAHI